MSDLTPEERASIAEDGQWILDYIDEQAAEITQLKADLADLLMETIRLKRDLTYLVKETRAAMKIYDDTQAAVARITKEQAYIREQTKRLDPLGGAGGD